MQVQSVNPMYYNYSYKVQKVLPVEKRPSSCQPLRPIDYSIYSAEVERTSIYEPRPPKVNDRAMDVKPEVPLHPIERNNKPLDMCPEVFLYSKIGKDVSFGYSNKLKTLYKKGLLPTVRKGFYGGDLSKEVTTLEHLIPHSKGGATVLSNLVLATADNNLRRGNKHLSLFFKPEAAKEYLDQFIGVKVKNFNGDNYIKLVEKTLSKMGIHL